MGDKNKFIERMVYWCNIADLGYDQIQRWDIRDGGECDCSSLVIHALREAGFNTGSASYTGDLRTNLVNSGWDVLIPSMFDAIPGDILLNDEEHVAVVVSGQGWGATVAEAWLTEKNGIYYGESGDQTGLETRLRPMYNYPWKCILRWNGENDMVPEDLLYTKISTLESGNISVWEAWSWSYTYSKQCAAQINALATAVETLATTKDVDAHEVITTVDKAVRDRLKTLAAPEIDYDTLAKAVANAIPGGADSNTIAKATANELYKRLKA